MSGGRVGWYSCIRKHLLENLDYLTSCDPCTLQELEDELESLKQASTNGAPTDQPDSANDEELTRLREEKAELAESIKQLDNKLIDIKDKNNVSVCVCDYALPVLVLMSGALVHLP